MQLDDVIVAVVSALRGRTDDLVLAIDSGAVNSLRSTLEHVHRDVIQRSRLAAIAAIVAYSLNAIEKGEEWRPIPSALAEHVRQSARTGVRAGIVVRRCLEARRQFVRVIRAEIEKTGYTDRQAALKHLHETYASLWEHIIVSVEREYEQEQERLVYVPDERRMRLVRRLLMEDLSPARWKELDYETEAHWHLGMVTVDDESIEPILSLQKKCGEALLCIKGDDGNTWAWLRQRDALTFAQFKTILSAAGGVDSPLATGEPRYGIEGWRQTHREAQIAWLVAHRALCGLTRCADALPVASAAQDHAIVNTYHDIYILPLRELPNGGHVIRKSLCAYVKHGRSASSAGKAIGVTARTIENHLKEARKALGSPLNLTALEIALMLDELGYMSERHASYGVAS